MLDLSAVKKVYYEIKLQDGTELKIGKPTQSMVEYCINAMSAVKEEVDIEAIHALATLFVKILNRNNEGIKFKEEDIIEEIIQASLIFSRERFIRPLFSV